MGVYIGDKFNDYSAMQGPCSTGFHVPINTEWTTVIDDGVTIGAWAISGGTSDMSSKLKLPIAGTYSRTGSLSNRGSVAEYWCCNQYTSDTYGYAIYLTSIQINKTFGEMKSCGLPVRPFKDEIVVPDSTWTTIHDGSGIAPGAGIFRNSTLGLISISADGTNWTTIGDKNLGATEVWSSGTLTAENTGTYFQRGNNYGFPFAGGFTTSGTRVDASTYGPGNYYYGTTYITTSSPNDWSSVRVPNLRGGVTGIVISSKELKAAYIGEYGWKPGANTLFYYNLNQSNSTFTDAMGHTTNNSGVVYSANGVSDGCGYNSANFNRIQGLFNSGESFPSNFTIMGFMKPTGNSWSSDHPMGIVLTNGSTYTVWGIGFNQSNSQVQFNHLRENVAWDTSTYTFSALNSWHHYAMTFNGTNMVGYIDGTQVTTKAVSGSGSGSPYASTGGFTIFGRYVTGGENTSGLANVIQGYVDEVICEDKVRTAQEIQDYLANFTY